jgi:hypothetical protein
MEIQVAAEETAANNIRAAIAQRPKTARRLQTSQERIAQTKVLDDPRAVAQIESHRVGRAVSARRRLQTIALNLSNGSFLSDARLFRQTRPRALLLQHSAFFLPFTS